MKFFLAAALVMVMTPLMAAAYYTNDNFWDLPHERPAWFELDDTGGFYGETERGTPFFQRPVLTDIGVRLHKFMIGEAYFYVSDRGIITAGSDLVAVSVYLTLV